MLADQVAETGFQAIFGIRAPLARAQMRFRPKIARVGGSAAEIKRDQVVFLIVPNFTIIIAVIVDLGAFEPFGNVVGWSHGGGPAPLANGAVDILLRHRRIDRAWRQIVVRQGGLGDGEAGPEHAESDSA